VAETFGSLANVRRSSVGQLPGSIARPVGFRWIFAAVASRLLSCAAGRSRPTPIPQKIVPAGAGSRAMSEADFQKFVEILQSGDAEAVDRLLSEFDPMLRQAIRKRLFDRRARRIVDTADILQSLLKDFLDRNETVGAASVQRLEAYLTAAAHYKVASKVRKERRKRADLTDIPEPASSGTSASQQIEDRDFIDAVRRRLNDVNRRLFDLSQGGMTWAQIGNECGGHPDTLRIQLRRSIAAALAEMREGERSHAD
jgi:DNA-directed RNA polymerase specialized sigma24 family protein